MNAGVDRQRVNRARWRSAPVPRSSSRRSSLVIVSVSPSSAISQWQQARSERPAAQVAPASRWQLTRSGTLP